MDQRQRKEPNEGTRRSIALLAFLPVSWGADWPIMLTLSNCSVYSIQYAAGDFKHQE